MTMEKVYINEKQAIKSPNSTSQKVVTSGSTSSAPVEKSRNHRLELDGHQLLSVWGVKGVPAFGDKEIKIQLENESLLVTGQNLEIKLLNLDQGQVIAKGCVTGLKYSSGGVEKGFLKRIFK